MDFQVADGLKSIPRRAMREAGALALAAGNIAGPDPKAVHIIIGVILGAAGGAFGGLVVARLLGFIAYMAGQRFEGKFLIAIGAVAGAGLLAWMVATRGGF